MHASDVCFPFATTPEEWKRSRVKKLLICSKPPQGLVPAMRCPWSQKLAQLSTAAIVYKPSPPSPVLSTCIVVFRWVHHLQQSFFVVRLPEEKVAIVDLLLSPSSFCLVCDFFAGGGRERGVIATVVKTMVIIVVEWDGGDAAAGGGEVGGLRGSGVGGEKTKVESMVAAAVCDVIQVAVSLALMVVTKVVAATLEADVVVKSPVMAGSSSFRVLPHHPPPIATSALHLQAVIAIDETDPMVGSSDHGHQDHPPLSLSPTKNKMMKLRLRQQQIDCWLPPFLA
nr:hypothetical protein Iba_chr05eCG9700 [Ipomoea batatas]